MKTKMLLEHFTAKALPLLQTGCATEDELRAKAVDFLTDVELVDAEGNTAEVDSLDLEVKAQTTTTDADGKSETADISATITKAVEAAIAKALPKAVATKKPHQIIKQVEVSEMKRFGPLQSFVGTINGKSADERAYRFGRYIAAIRGHNKSVRWCKEHGVQLQWTDDNEPGDIMVKGHAEGTNTTGGYLVPDEFETDMIDLRVQYGVFRREARVKPMGSDFSSRPRRTGGLTAYFVAEDGTGTESTKSWDRVSLTAKKLMVLTRSSNELYEDALLNLGDDFAGEIAYAFANKEDLCGFIGDGTTTYGGIVGVTPRLKTLYGTGGGIGLIVGDASSGATWSNLTLGTFNRVQAALPDYPIPGGPKWYMSRNFYYANPARLEYAAGGNSLSVIEGGTQQRFLGDPVIFTDALPITRSANSEVVCVYGSMRLAADFGDRRGTTIAMSDSALNAFEKDELIWRGTERFDINVHDFGTSSVAGPVVGLITATS